MHTILYIGHDDILIRTRYGKSVYNHVCVHSVIMLILKHVWDWVANGILNYKYHSL